MGRSEWLYKASGGGDGSGGSGGGGGGTSQTTKPPVKKKTTRRDKRNNSSSGCMTAIFKLFDIQNHQFRFHHPSFMSSESSAINHNPQLSNIALQGVEAPRNSLQSPESMAEVTPRPSSSSSKVKKEQINFNIPMKIKTKRSDDLSSECSSSSPSTKTPNLVARLMGLDLLPEYSSPRPSSSSSVTTTPANSHHRSRSLPATPRISTASRRSTDNDNYNHHHNHHHHHHHRLSLQIDKENCKEHESLEMKMARRRSELLSTVNRQDDDDYKSQYAKQIANQVRERISRRLGTDITNTISPATRRDSNLVLLKPKKPAPVPAPAQATKTKRDDSIPFSSSSPKLGLLDINNNLNRPISYTQTPLMKVGKAEKCKKIMASERYDLRLKKIHPQPQDEVFVNKKKSTPLSNHVVNHVTNSSSKKLISFKKEMRSSSSSSSSTTRLHQKQVSLIPSSLNSSSYNSNATHTLNFSVQDSTSTIATSSSATATTTTTGRRRFSDHFNVYISRIINHCKITQCYSPSHPLHPSIFHQIEKLFYSTATTAGAGAGERRMIFELVDEFLVEMVKPCGLIMCGKELIIGKLCEKIMNIPAVNCEVLEDIDGVIERDIGRSMRRLLTAAIESEAEEIVKEIESEIVETMVHEMVISLTDSLKSFT